MRRVLPLCVVVLLAGLASALVNPNFTPIHLTAESQFILKARLVGKDVADKADFEVMEALKGQKPDRLRLDLSQAPKQHAEAARKQLAGEPSEPVLLFAGKFEGQEVGYLHVRGSWMRLSGQGGTWQLLEIDQNMPGTWNGGTDMLERCVRYILESKELATVPVDAAVGWRSIVAVGQAGGAVGVAVVDLGGGRPAVHLISPEGDKLLLPAKGKESFEDATARLGLTAKSLAAAWADFDQDGRTDLLSADGAGLTLWRQDAAGKFAPTKVAAEVKMPAGAAALAVVAAAPGAPPSVVAAGEKGPVLLKGDGKGGFAATPLPAPAGAEKLGKMQPLLAADLTGDGLCDVLLPYENGGLLYVGAADGSFAAPKPCAVGCSAGGGVCTLADLDADGRLDVLVAGSEGMRIYHNAGGGRFDESLYLSGEVSYKAQPLGSWCGAGDFNNDGRMDLLVAYAAQGPLMYYNRGFRSFAEAPKLEGKLGETPGLEGGQRAASFGDFDDDGGLDVLLVGPDGKVFCAFGDKAGEQAEATNARCLRLSLPGKAFAGPVVASVWHGTRCIGAVPVRAGLAAGHIGVEEAGQYVVKWQLPGQPAKEKKVTIDDKPVAVTLE